jgi:hypothetical protein
VSDDECSTLLDTIASLLLVEGDLGEAVLRALVARFRSVLLSLVDRLTTSLSASRAQSREWFERVGFALCRLLTICPHCKLSCGCAVA